MQCAANVETFWTAGGDSSVLRRLIIMGIARSSVFFVCGYNVCDMRGGIPHGERTAKEAADSAVREPTGDRCVMALSRPGCLRIELLELQCQQCIQLLFMLVLRVR